MSEQAQTVAAPDLAVPSTTDQAGGAPRDDIDIPVSKLQNKKLAGDRIRELLVEVKNLKRLREQDRADADTQIEQLRSELLAVRAENDDFRAREEQRLSYLRDAEEVGKREAEARLEHFLGVMVGCAHQSGAYAKHPDFDSRLKRACLPTRLLEAIVCFSPEIAAEIAYTLASNQMAVKELSQLGTAAIAFRLERIGKAIEERMNFQKLMR